MAATLRSIVSSLMVIVLALGLSSCPNMFGDRSSGGINIDDDNDGDSPTGITITDKTLWGHWIRMDSAENWYVANNIIKRDGTALALSAAGTGSITAGGHSILKASDNVLRVNNGAFYLYRQAGIQGTMTGRLMGDTTGSRSLGGIGGIQVVIRNQSNPANVNMSLTSSMDGTFDLSEVIPGDSYELTVNAPGAPSLTVTPQSLTEDIGTISLTPQPYNFKVSAETATGYQYADTPFQVTVKVRNIGTASSYGTSWVSTLAQAAGVSVSSTTPAILGTIDPGAEKTISMTVTVSGFESEYYDSPVRVNIKDVNNGIWEDSFSIRVYKRPMTVRVSSINLPVFGIILSPERQGTWFQTAGTGAYKTTELELPYREVGYIISLSRASSDTETAYSVGLDAEVATEADFLAFFNDPDSPSSFEPNNTETQMALIANGEAFSSYLHSTDLDFFVVGLVAQRPVVSVAAGTYDQPLTVSLSSGTSDASFYYTLDGSNPVTAGSLATGDLGIDRPLTLKVLARKAGLTDSTVASVTYSFQAARPMVSPATTAGTWTISTETPGATIRYTLGGDDPTEASAVYMPGTELDPAGQVLKAKAWREYWGVSELGFNSSSPTVSITANLASVNNSSIYTALVSDDDTPESSIEVRWDWDSDDLWDTDWSIVKTASYTYTSTGEKTVIVQARDQYGATGSTMVTVNSYYLSNFAMVSLPAGSFNNGTSIVTLSAFRMATTEVTQSWYQTVMGSNPSHANYGIGVNNPVNQVNWYDALVFCNKLSILEGRTPVYSISGSTDPSNWGVVPTDYNSTWNAATMNMDANGYRLPTEAEWEYAARGGDPVDSFTYAGSNDVGTVAWHSSNSGGTTKPVAGKTPNKVGLYDMSGNVWEWTWDWHGVYPTGLQNDPIGVASGTYRVYRGGSFFQRYSSGCAVSYRWYSYLYAREYNTGFRVVSRP